MHVKIDRSIVQLLINIFYFLPVLTAIAPSTTRASMADSIHYELQELIVTATRVQRVDAKLPYAISVIEIDENEAITPNASLEEVLRDVPGILVDNRNNLSQGDRISSRGLGIRAQFGVRGVKVL